MKVIQINTTANSCSHGRIADEIGGLLIERGHKNYIAYGRTQYECRSELIKIGGKIDLALHLAKTRLFDRHGLGSTRASNLLVKKIEAINPDIIHLHNVHGYYLNFKVLFKALKDWNKPVVWTFHDCWPFTGHCAHFQQVNCNKWQTECFDCPLTHRYPKSWFIDNSRKNYHEKKELFTGLKKLVLVSPSEWLADNLGYSFLSDYEIRVINNGVDLIKFRPIDTESIRTNYDLNKKYILGVASIWTKSKGLEDFISLRKILDPEIEIVLVGLTRSQIKSLPVGLKGIPRTENIGELTALYSAADVFVNPTYADNFPATNIEALACGTPVITYRTGGSPEAISSECGYIVGKGDIQGLWKATIESMRIGKEHYRRKCRDRAVELFDKNNRYLDYIELYKKLSNQ